MPNRPPKSWWRRCVEAVALSSSAASPQAVCGANWSRKSAAERRALTRAAEGGKTRKARPCRACLGKGCDRCDDRGYTVR